MSQEVRRLEHHPTAPGDRAGSEPGPLTPDPVLAIPGSFWDSRKFGAQWRNLMVAGGPGHNWDLSQSQCPGEGGSVKPFMGAAFKDTFGKQSVLL